MSSQNLCAVPLRSKCTLMRHYSYLDVCEEYPMKKIINLIVLLSIVSCAPISLNRSYVDEMQEHEDQGIFVAGKTFETVPGDSGDQSYQRDEMLKRTPFKEEDSPEWSEKQKIEKELKYKVSRLGETQKIWFKRNQHLFENDSQRLYFLSLDGKEREEYLASITSKIVKTSRRSPASFLRYSPRGTRAVAVGMAKSEVSKIWGNPHRVDVAGDPNYENERWTFYEGRQKRYVYFESGRVEGWVTE